MKNEAIAYPMVSEGSNMREKIKKIIQKNLKPRAVKLVFRKPVYSFMLELRGIFLQKEEVEE